MNQIKSWVFLLQILNFLAAQKPQRADIFLLFYLMTEIDRRKKIARKTANKTMLQCNVSLFRRVLFNFHEYNNNIGICNVGDGPLKLKQTAYGLQKNRTWICNNKQAEENKWWANKNWVKRKIKVRLWENRMNRRKQTMRTWKAIKPPYFITLRRAMTREAIEGEKIRTENNNHNNRKIGELKASSRPIEGFSVGLFFLFRAYWSCVCMWMGVRLWVCRLLK